MIRTLLALLVLLGAIYLIFRMTTGGQSDQPMETQKQAMEKAEQAKETVERRTEEMQKRIEHDTGNKKDDDDPR